MINMYKWCIKVGYGVSHNLYDVNTNYYKVSRYGCGRGDGHGDGYGNLLDSIILKGDGYLTVEKCNMNIRPFAHWSNMADIIIELKIDEIHK